MSSEMKFMQELQELDLTEESFKEFEDKLFNQENLDQIKFKARGDSPTDKKIVKILKLLKI
jgi:hypothetical protein